MRLQKPLYVYMNRKNYQKELEKKIEQITCMETVPKLLLHACCAPCSSYVLEYLSQYFCITVLFYNPNISSEEEYVHRAEELQRLVNEMPMKNNVDVIVEPYDSAAFYQIARGYETCREGGERCFRCYALRLEEAAVYAKKINADYFTTTLSISPLKNAQKLNEIGAEMAAKYEVPYLFSDFKKKEGYKRSIELSKEYDLYRQNFCGCIYSKTDK